MLWYLDLNRVSWMLDVLKVCLKGLKGIYKWLILLVIVIYISN